MLLISFTYNHSYFAKYLLKLQSFTQTRLPQHLKVHIFEPAFVGRLEEQKMATLEGIRGGGGSIRVGTVGTISSLMTRELESIKSTSSPRTPRSHDIIGPSKPRKSTDESSSSSSSSSTKQSSKPINPDIVSKPRKSHRGPVHSVTTPKRPNQKSPLEDTKGPRRHRTNSQIPMLGSENIHLEKTPIRVMPMKKGLNIVDIVDVGCGSPSISDRLKKLGFSKLSQSFM